MIIILVIIWILITVILNLQMKYTIQKYGSKTHNSIKPIMCAICLLPMLKPQSINLPLNVIFLLITSLTIVILYSNLYNKMVETTPIYIMNTVMILTSLFTMGIDIFTKEITMTRLILILTVTKTIGLFFVIVYSQRTEDDSTQNIKNNITIYSVILLITILNVTRMYIISSLKTNHEVNSVFISLITQISIATFTILRYRKQIKPVTKKMIITYIPQIITTILSDLILLEIIKKGVSITIDYQAIILLLLLIIEKRTKLNKITIAGVVVTFISIVTILPP